MHSQREGEPEGRALPHLALDPPLPAMGIDDGLANVQANTQALSASALHRNAWRAVEWLPYPHLLFARQTRPLIAHGHPRQARVNLQAHHYRLVRTRALKCIGQAVVEQLAEPIPIR